MIKVLQTKPPVKTKKVITFDKIKQLLVYQKAKV